jgi:hypothetical protein
MEQKNFFVVLIADFVDNTLVLIFTHSLTCFCALFVWSVEHERIILRSSSPTQLSVLKRITLSLWFDSRWILLHSNIVIVSRRAVRGLEGTHPADSCILTELQ